MATSTTTLTLINHFINGAETAGEGTRTRTRPIHLIPGPSTTIAN
ncbi:hypothetical protein [Arthrobacter sp. BE255]|nr:hypothetical protein [Arthrobacter sp. BE255]MDR7159578.1 hypothetical protein [Arthrobacter sp. BE255]